MSTKRNIGSSISTRNAKKRTSKIQRTQRLPQAGSREFSPTIVKLPNSSSPLDKIYQAPEFQLAWDSQLGFRLAEQLIQLRHYRKLSQAEMAKKARTSQSAVARTESGEANVTIDTLQRFVEALRGRVQVGITPAEMHVPQLPPWWELGDYAYFANVCIYEGCAVEDDGVKTRVVAGWTAETPTAAKQWDLTVEAAIPFPQLQRGGVA